MTTTFNGSTFKNHTFATAEEARAAFDAAKGRTLIIDGLLTKVVFAFGRTTHHIFQVQS